MLVDIEYSVVIPAYNASATILTAIESVYRQKAMPVEVIIVNDGSTDETVGLVKDYLRQNNITTCRIINQENGGPSRARNKGIQEAKTDWIAFLDADDAWHEEKAEIQIAYLKKYKELVLIGSKLGALEASYRTVVGNKFASLLERVQFKKLLLKNYFATSSVFARKDVLLESGLFDEGRRHSEDYEVWLKIAGKYPTAYVNLNLAVYGDGKRGFGVKGLSADLKLMEIGELKAYRNLYKLNYFSFFKLIMLCCFSLLKYFRRIVIGKFTN